MTDDDDDDVPGEEERQINMTLGLALLAVLIWLGCCGVQAVSCVPEADETDGPVPAVSSHVGAMVRATP
jgi:hypothetical protein